MERDLLKKRRRILSGKCGEICDDEGMSGKLPDTVYCSVYEILPSGYYTLLGRLPNVDFGEGHTVGVTMLVAGQIELHFAW